MSTKNSSKDLVRLFGNIFREQARPIIEARFPRDNSLLEPLYYTLESTPLHFAGGVSYIVACLSGMTKGATLSALAEVIYSTGVIHDDFCDGTSNRRGVRACHAHFGVNKVKRFLPFVATLLYDFLLQEGFEREVQDGYREMIITTLLAVEELETFTLSTDLEAFLDNSQRRASFLIWAVDVASGSSPYRSALKRYEMNLGIAGQLRNDLRDLYREGCNDIYHAQPTYPLALLYTKMPARERGQFCAHFEPHADPEFIQFVLANIQEHGILEDCLAVIHTYVEKALTALCQVPDCYEKKVLDEFARSYIHI